MFIFQHLKLNKLFFCRALVAISLVLISNGEEVLLSVPVEAQALRENKTIGARRNHLNFALPDISSSPINEGSGHFTLSGGYKQSGGGLIGYY